MARSVPEWIGKTPDTAIPARVKARVFGKEPYPPCANCGRLIVPWEGWQCDHTKALVNGGENRESNLQVLCLSCHVLKTASDVAEKATIARKRKKHLGIKRRQSRPMPGTKASGIRKPLGGGPPIDRATGKEL